MINNNKLNFIRKKPFHIFEINNFLNENLYNDLRDSFPKLSDFETNKLNIYQNKKFSINSDSLIYREILNNNNTYLKFHNFIHSREFKLIFFYKIFSKIFFSRGFDFKHIFKMFRIPLFKDFKKKKNTHYLSIFNKLKITVQLSYILNQGCIVPHKDATDKLVTLMIYLPDNENQKSAGTSFWNIKERFKLANDEHLNNQEERNYFYQNSELLYCAPFVKNKIVGFIKNQSSWHSVEKINLTKDEDIRKSININIYY